LRVVGFAGGDRDDEERRPRESQSRHASGGERAPGVHRRRSRDGGIGRQVHGLGAIDALLGGSSPEQARAQALTQRIPSLDSGSDAPADLSRCRRGRLDSRDSTHFVHSDGWSGTQMLLSKTAPALLPFQSCVRDPRQPVADCDPRAIHASMVPKDVTHQHNFA